MQGVVITITTSTRRQCREWPAAGSRGLLGDNSAPEQDFALISVVIIKCYTDRICHCQTLGRAGELIQFNQFHGTFVMKNAGNVLLCSHTTRWSPAPLYPDLAFHKPGQIIRVNLSTLLRMGRNNKVARTKTFLHLFVVILFTMCGE